MLHLCGNTFLDPSLVKSSAFLSFWFPALMPLGWLRAPFNMEFREFLLPTAYISTSAYEFIVILFFCIIFSLVISLYIYIHILVCTNPGAVAPNKELASCHSSAARILRGCPRFFGKFVHPIHTHTCIHKCIDFCMQHLLGIRSVSYSRQLFNSWLTNSTSRIISRHAYGLPPFHMST